MKLTLAITVFNRWELLLESFANVIDDDRIDEILIMDDHSKDEYWNKIKELPKFNPKIKVVRQLENRNMLINKRDAIFNSKNELVILFDSDNVIGKDYLDSLPNEFYEDIIYCPSFAKPTFDFRKYSGIVIDKKIASQNINDNTFNMMLNCCNYLVNRNAYLESFIEDRSVKGSDTISFAYNWLKQGNRFQIVTGMEYYHRVHSGSGFLENADFNMRKAEETKKMISAL